MTTASANQLSHFKPDLVNRHDLSVFGFEQSGLVVSLFYFLPLSFAAPYSPGGGGSKVQQFKAKITLASPYEFFLKTVAAKDHSGDTTLFCFKAIRGNKGEVPVV